MSKTKQKLDQNTIHRVLKLIRPYTGMDTPHFFSP